MKILFYNHTGKVSGGERVLATIVARLDRRRFEPIVLCPADGSLAAMMNTAGVRTIEIEALVARFTWRPARLVRYFASFVRLMSATRRVVASESPDLVHANSIRSGLVMTIATIGLRVPVVWHVHDLLPRHPLSSAIRLIAFIFQRTHIVAVSRAVDERFRGSLVRWFPKRAAITVIHNAIDIEKFQPNSVKRAETRNALGFAGADFVVGTVGQLTARKGQLELINAFADLAVANPNAKLVIVGAALFNRDFEYAEALHEAVKRLGVAGRVLFLGAREDVAELTRAFDLAIVNSQAEPFGLTVVEAMASGTPVLATAVDGIPEIVEHGHSGWLITNGNHGELVEGIEKLISDRELRSQLSDVALRTARSRFAAHRFIDEIETLYRSISSAHVSRSSAHRQKLEVNLSAD